MGTVTELFGSMVFNDSVMRERLSDDIYETLQLTIKHGKHLSYETAEAVATAMKDWAIEKGATHYTHWFQPMTGITAEKHDGFISPAPDGMAIMEFSGKELIQGEPDASSFPSGGLRATFEARGYTAWDATSYAFIKDGVLCIPTAFCSYGGEALDKKTPLLRSMEAINIQAMRILKIFGNNEVISVKTTVGPEQEYFLVPAELYYRRKDLIFTGRTLFGARPPKGQELDDHYFAAIKPQVSEFMKELDEELWKLGVFAKTEHNEAAPAQHELAPVFTTANIAADHNQLTMELMQKIAKKHGLVCLLAEKPFESVNGSGKHNNWSISTDSGINLFEPGETPSENAQFLLLLSAVIKAVDEYQDLLRISVASAGNDRRLGSHEAPPTIISIFLGEELTDILEAIEEDRPCGAKEKEFMRVGVHTLPKFPKDTTDRNRTSPFAFTGNKFEFRMLGASASVSDVNVVLNTSVAEALRGFADELERKADLETALHDIIKNTIKAHRRIIFNGNGYDEAWVREAERRGLLNLKTTPDAVAHLLDEKNVRLFTSHKVLSETELLARRDIMLENYCKVINIEALTMISMVRKDILPAVNLYAKSLAEAAITKKSLCPDIDTSFAEDNVRNIAFLTGKAYSRLMKLESELSMIPKEQGHQKSAYFYKEVILVDMEELRAAVDELEALTASDMWPFPTYGELLFGVK